MPTFLPSTHPGGSGVDRVYVPRLSGGRPSPHPDQTLRVFYPAAQVPKPSGGWPVLMYSPSGVFSNLFTIDTIDETTSPKLLHKALVSGWCVVVVRTVGLNSDPALLPIPGAAPNLFHPFASAEWDRFDVYWGEKDFSWARQYLAEYADSVDPDGWPALEIDNDKVVTSGVSSGSVYAAFVALGRDRAYASSATQTSRSTRCAGFIGYSCPTWMPAFDEATAATHWPSCEDPSVRAATIAEAHLPTLIAASPSTWVREPGSHAATTPCVLAYDEGVATDDMRRTHPTSGFCGVPNPADPEFAMHLRGDPCLRNTIPPNGDPGQIHDYWFGRVLYADLKNVAALHATESQLIVSSELLATYPQLPVRHTGSFADDRELQRTAHLWLRQRIRPQVRATPSRPTALGPRGQREDDADRG